jgi:hypothetical protein
VADASITLDLMKIMLSYIFKKEMHQQPKGGEVHLTTPSGALIIVVLASYVAFHSQERHSFFCEGTREAFML